MKHDAGTRESIAHRRDVSIADGRPYPRSGSFQVVICTAAPPSNLESRGDLARI